jgi:hypothetical protein
MEVLLVQRGSVSSAPDQQKKIDQETRAHAPRLTQASDGVLIRGMSKLSAISVGALVLSAASLGCGPSPEANSPAPPAPTTEEPAPAPGDVSASAEDVSAAPADAPTAASAPTTAKGVIEAYYAAVEAGDKEAAFALLTPEARENAKTSKKSFTYVFFEMGFKVKTWKLKRDVEEQGDTASGSVKAVLMDEKGKDDNEGMRFKLVRQDGKWLIAEIN